MYVQLYVYYLFSTNLMFSGQLKLAFIICSGLVKAREVLFIIQRQMQLSADLDIWEGTFIKWQKIYRAIRLLDLC